MLFRLLCVKLWLWLCLLGLPVVVAAAVVAYVCCDYNQTHMCSRGNQPGKEGKASKAVISSACPAPANRENGKKSGMAIPHVTRVTGLCALPPLPLDRRLKMPQPALCSITSWRGIVCHSPALSLATRLEMVPAASHSGQHWTVGSQCA